MTDQPNLPLLGGEADPSTWHFQNVNQAGPLPNPVGHTFPLITHDEDGCWRIVGTGFYVTDNGLFVTARHVVDEVCLEGRQIAPLLIVHQRSDTGLFGPTEWLLRPIMQCWLADQADIAFGAAATATNNETGQTLSHWTWRLSWAVPSISASVATYAFPGKQRQSPDGSFTFRADSYVGQVEDAGEYRDAVMMPFAYLQVGFRMHGATSGGPIILDGRVVGVNCTEYEPHDVQDKPLAFGAQIRCLRDAFLDDVIPLNEETPRRMSFDEFVLTGSIDVWQYVPRETSEPFSGSVVRLGLPYTAPRPRISFEIYA
jgi:trypsin-like peptidase